MKYSNETERRLLSVCWLRERECVICWSKILCGRRIGCM